MNKYRIVRKGLKIFEVQELNKNIPHWMLISGLESPYKIIYKVKSLKQARKIKQELTWKFEGEIVE